MKVNVLAYYHSNRQRIRAQYGKEIYRLWKDSMLSLYSTSMEIDEEKLDFATRSCLENGFVIRRIFEE